MNRNRLNNLVQLLIQNRERPRDFRIENEGEDEATVYLYDVIGESWFGGVGARDFARQIGDIKAGTIHLRINSPGGDTWDARAMMTALRQHPAKVVAHIDGVAASAATMITMAADEVEITRGAEFMIHEAWTIQMGNKGDFLDVAQRLEAVDLQILTDYVNRTGLDRDQLDEWMRAETWFTAEQTVEHGFADRVVETVKGGKSAQALAGRWDLSAYRNAPQRQPEPEPEPKEIAEAEAFRANLERRLRLVEAAGA